jgi:hypothetical protein
MWAQSWNKLGSRIRPYPNSPITNVTREMLKLGWTTKKMYEKADEFYQSMGLPAMTREAAIHQFGLVNFSRD